MEKMAAGPEAVGIIDIHASVTDNLKAAAKAKNKDIQDVAATILYRERDKQIIAELREAGARIKRRNDGGIAAAIHTVFDSTGVDLLFGSGGAPEWVLMQARGFGEKTFYAEMTRFLRGVPFKGTYAEIKSVVMRAKSGTVRFVDGCPSLNKKPNLVTKP